MALVSETKERRHQLRPYRMSALRGGSTLAVVHEWTDAHALSRRAEMRVSEAKLCGYQLCEPIGQERVSILQGEAYCVNRSGQGIQVMMGNQPRVGQLLEVQLRESPWRYSAGVYEVRWTNVLPIESQGVLYLVGCRLVFRPAP